MKSGLETEFRRRGTREEFRELVEAARRQAGPAPTPDELLAYLEDELSPDEEERLQNRLVLDPESVRTTLDLVDPTRLDPTPETDDVPVPTWASIRARLDDPEVSAPAVRVRSAAVHPAWRWAVAALVPLVLGLGLWVGQLLRPASGPQAAPRINVFHWELLPIDSGLPRDAVVEEEIVAAPATPQLLVLHLGDRGAFAEYHLEIRDADGRPHWRGSGLEPSPIGTFNVELPPDFLSSGRWELRLRGVGEDGAEALLATYRLELLSPLGPPKGTIRRP